MKKTDNKNKISNDIKSSFSLTQALSVANIIVSFAGLYLKRKELSFVQHSSKDSSEVAKDFQKIYKRALKWPKVLQIDPGREFMGEVTKEMTKHNTRIRRGNENVHRDQGIVEHFNRTLSEKRFSFQYSREMNFKSGERSREWVKRLREVFSALNSEETRLTGKKPVDAIKEKVLETKPSTNYSRRVGLRENLRYLLAAAW